MNRYRVRSWRRLSLLTLAAFVLFGVVPMSAQAADDDASPRFYSESYQSNALGKEMTYRIYLPEGYADNNQRYPVVYLLHSEGHSSQQFADDNTADLMDQWTAQGTIQKMIVVMPDTSGDSWFVNQDNGNWEDMLTQDLIPIVDQRYRTIAAPSSRGISGISMGGFGAFVNGLRHPELFGSIASHMGALNNTVGGFNPMAIIKGKTAAQLRAYAYYLDGGTEDPLTYATDSTNDIHAYFRANNVSHGYQTRPGSHDASYYLAYLNRSFMTHAANFSKGLLSGSFSATPQAIGIDDTNVGVQFTVNLNRGSVTQAVYDNQPNSAFMLNVGLKVTDPMSSAVLYETSTSLGDVVLGSSESSFTGSFNIPVAELGTSKNTNLTLDAKLLGSSFPLGTKPLIRVTPTGELPEDTQIDLYGDWRFTKDTFPTASINGADESLDTSSWSVVQPGLDWWAAGFGGYGDLGNYLGSAWYVKKFYVPEDFPDEDLTLMAGKIDDADMTYINGQLVGETGFANGSYTMSYWAASREYAIPSNLLKRGEMNTISVYLYNQNGGGGWYAGPIGIYTKAAAQKIKKLPSKVPASDVIAKVKATAQAQFTAIENKNADAYSRTLSENYFNAGVDKLAATKKVKGWFGTYKSIAVEVHSPYVFELDGRYLYTAQVAITGTLENDTQHVIEQGTVSQYYVMQNGVPVETGDQKLFYKTSFYSESAQREVTFRVFLPPSYFAQPDKRFPSVYLLHQFNSDSESFEIDNVDGILNDGIADGTLKDMIVVIPDSEGMSWWVNRTVKWQDMVVKDLVTYVDGHLRTIDDARYRGVSGVSMGGYGAFIIGLQYPDVFSSVASHMGALSYPQEGQDPIAIIKNYPVDALKQYSIYLDSGNLDVYKFDVPVNTVHKYLMDNGVPHYAEVRDGAHDSAFYTKSIDLSFAMHGTHFASANVADGVLTGSITAGKSGGSISASFSVAANQSIGAYAYRILNSPYVKNTDPQLKIPVVLEAYNANNEKIAKATNLLTARGEASLEGTWNLPELAREGLYRIVLKASVLDRTFVLGQATYDSRTGSNSGTGSGSGGAAVTPVVAEEAGQTAASATEIRVAIEGRKSLSLLAESGSTLDIPYETLQQLIEAAGSSTVKSIVWQTKPVDAAESGTLLRSGSTAFGGTLQIAGEFVDLELSAVLDDGTTAPLGLTFKKPVLLRLKTDPGANPELTGIYYWGADGQPQYVGGKWNADGTVSVELSHFSRYGVLTFAKSFVDLPAGHWSNRAVQALAAKHLIDGVGENRFAPDRQVSRAEFAVMIYNALGLKAEANAVNPFRDVAAGSWYANAISAVYHKGIVQGKNADRFDPNATLTREEMAVMLFNAYRQTGSAATFDGNLDALARFKDNGQIHAWAKDQMNALVQLGLLNGQSAKSIAPGQPLSRAEAAQAIYSLTKLMTQ